MSHIKKIQFGLLLAVGAVQAWEFQQSSRQAGQLASVRAQIEAQKLELESRSKVLEALEERNRELDKAEQEAGNKRLLSLLRERNVVSMVDRQAASQAAGESSGLGQALAKVLDSPEQRQANQETRQAEMRAGLYQFFKLINLSPEKQQQYVDLNIENERRMSERLSALLQGKMSLEEAERQRASDEAAHEQQCREVLGDEGMKLLNGIADGMRTDAAKRLVGIIQANMGANPLTQDQMDQLQPLIKDQIVGMNMDDVELFRPRDAWTQYCLDRQQQVLAGAGAFLSPTQLETLKTIGAYDLANRQKQMDNRRTALGIKLN
jgi:hypothetical protein